MLNVWQWIAVIGGLATVGLAAAFVIGMRRTGYNAVQMMFFLIAWGLTRILWRTRSPRGLPLPKGQGAVLVCNHRSSIDPFFIQVVAHRKVHWMVAREFCQKGLIGWFLRSCEVIQVARRGVDTAATRAAIRYAAAGDLVGVFPEGRINTTDDFMLPVRPGAALMALKAGAPILPCYIEGAPYNGTPASPLFMRARVNVKFGDLIDTAPYAGRERDPEVLQELTLRSVKEIARLAGKPDFEPQLAGKKWRDGDETDESNAAASEEA
jgi:1-acyl-sn-glycerol-3-phosphate acyltransferase